jgi:hypothetical protein
MNLEIHMKLVLLALIMASFSGTVHADGPVSKCIKGHAPIAECSLVRGQGTMLLCAVSSSIDQFEFNGKVLSEAKETANVNEMANYKSVSGQTGMTFSYSTDSHPGKVTLYGWARDATCRVVTYIWD